MVPEYGLSRKMVKGPKHLPGRMHNAKRNADRQDLLRQAAYEADQSIVADSLSDFDRKLKLQQEAREEEARRKKEEAETQARRDAEMRARQEKQRKKEEARAKALAMSTK